MAPSKPVFPQALSTAFAHRLANSHNSLFSNISTSRQAKRQANKVNYAEDYNDLDFEFEDNSSSNNNNNTTNNNTNINDLNNLNNLNNNDSIGLINGNIIDGSHFNNLDSLDYTSNIIVNNNNTTNNNNIDNNNDFDNDNYNDNNDGDYLDDYNNDDDYDDERKDATYEDPNAAFDIYKNLILNSNNNSKINLSNFQGNKEAPSELPKIIFSPQQIIDNSINSDIIIPIKLKINTSTAVINDQFLWNLNDNLITPELFSSILSQELDLNRNAESLILNQIKDQIQSFKDLLSNPNNSIIDNFLTNEKEFHVILDISCNIGEDFYTDKIEWDLLDNTLTPEMFAKTVCNDIGLKPEFETAISVAIYEEIYKFKRELTENPQQVSQNIDSLPFFNLINPDNASKSIVQGLRYDTKKYGEEFTPTIEKLSEWEIEKRETEKERNLRRRKRETLRVVSGVAR